MSPKEYQRAQETGFFTPGPDGRIHASENPESRYAESDSILVRFDYNLEDGWRAKWGGEDLYVITDQKIPFSRATRLN